MRDKREDRIAILLEQDAPMIGFEESDQKAFDTVEQAYKKRFPDRGVAGMRPGDTFTLEVPAGTFVTRDINRQPDGYEYISFNGDRLYYYPNEPAVVYARVPDSA